jgi:hypothetical protein
MSSYMIYQMVQAEQMVDAERAAEQAQRSPAPWQAAAQRRADAQLGEIAAAVAQLCRGVTRPATAVRAAFRHWHPGQPSPGPASRQSARPGRPRQAVPGQGAMREADA